MKNKIIKIFAFGFPTFIFIIFFLGLATDKTYDTRNIVGQKISYFTLNALIGDSQITEKDLVNNQFTLINFWSSWCAPCRAEHKTLLKLKDNPKLKILGINFKDSQKNAIIYLTKLGDPYQYIAQDKDGKASIKFGVYGIPESILIDGNLKIIKKYIGPLSKNDYLEILKVLY
jgi:cytochrome c biogenesis protein CcmG/thiol:disulfide interchange protein DsbE